MLCVDRCLWRRAWTKPSSTSAESWSTRPTTSTSPNPKLPAWRKDGPDTTECHHGLFSKTLTRTFLEAAEDEPRAPLWRCSVEQSSVGLVFFFVFLFNSFVFLKKRHFFLSRQFLEEKKIVLPCCGAAAAVWYALPHLSSRCFWRSSPNQRKFVHAGGPESQRAFFFFFLWICAFLLFKSQTWWEIQIILYFSTRLFNQCNGVSSAETSDLTSCLSHCTVCPLSGH